MASHPAVVTVTPRGKLEILQVLTPTPKVGEVRVRVEWTASTPLDLHQNDGHLLVTPPQILGSNFAGTIVEVGPSDTTSPSFSVGDRVFGFAWRKKEEKSHQLYVVLPTFLLARVPSTPEFAGELGLQRAVTVPDPFVTAWHTIVTDFSLSLPWPKPQSYVPPNANTRILVWGAGSSVGQYVVQVLKWAGYTNVLATASLAHHATLREMGAREVFNYRDVDVVERILAGGTVSHVLDCIGSVSGSIVPVSKIAKKGSVVAILLPVIIKDTSETEAPVYTMDAQEVVAWEDGVNVRGVRTHFYLSNALHAEKLQPEIMPTLLKEGVIRPTKIKLVEGKTLLERAQNALDTMRRKEVSGERLVWRVADAQ